jgi:hypothetical protein
MADDDRRIIQSADQRVVMTHDLRDAKSLDD